MGRVGSLAPCGCCRLHPAATSPLPPQPKMRTTHARIPHELQTLAAMAQNIVAEARARAEAEAEDDVDEEDYSDAEEEEDGGLSGSDGEGGGVGGGGGGGGTQAVRRKQTPRAPLETVLSVNEVTLQHCVLKAVLTVLDSAPGLDWVLAHEQAMVDIFASVQVIRWCPVCDPSSERRGQHRSSQSVPRESRPRSSVDHALARSGIRPAAAHGQALRYRHLALLLARAWGPGQAALHAVGRGGEMA